MTVRILVGDCRDHMAAMEPNFIDAIVTDPPYGLSFMGKGWDHGIPGVEFWRLALTVCKPGAHLLAFGGTRTHHRLACAIEDAGWEIRDCLMWLYGSGFPKSLDVSKAIDKAAGAEREVVAPLVAPAGNKGRTVALGGSWQENPNITAPATDLARKWEGWGTALKPAWEPIIMARKPLAGTVAANVERYGTGGINVDGCRIEGEPWQAHDATGLASVKFFTNGNAKVIHKEPHSGGRWPANVLLDEDAAAMLDAQSGDRPSGGYPPEGGARSHVTTYGKPNERGEQRFTSSVGGASRFFYTAKASRAERNKGLDGMPERVVHEPEPNGRAWDIPGSHSTARANHHPTVKPLDLMQWLVRLVTPPGGVVLDPFAGSGSTLVAADREGFDAIGIELDDGYAEIARRRITGDAPLFAEVAD